MVEGLEKTPMQSARSIDFAEAVGILSLKNAGV